MEGSPRETRQGLTHSQRHLSLWCCINAATYFIHRGHGTFMFFYFKTVMHRLLIKRSVGYQYFISHFALFEVIKAVCISLSYGQCLLYNYVSLLELCIFATCWDTKQFMTAQTHRNYLVLRPTGKLGLPP